MKHTYILQAAHWVAEGVFFDNQGQRIPVRGESQISHEPHRWRLESLMSLQVEPPVNFTSAYDILPLAEGAGTTECTSVNPALGTFHGQIVLIEDSILISMLSEGGRYHTFEYLLQIDEQSYRSRGTLLDGEQHVSSWAVDLRRQDEQSG